MKITGKNLMFSFGMNERNEITFERNKIGECYDIIGFYSKKKRIFI